MDSSAQVHSLQRRVEKLSSLLDVATAMAAERDFNQLLGLILREVRDVVEAVERDGRNAMFFNALGGGVG